VARPPQTSEAAEPEAPPASGSGDGGGTDFQRPRRPRRLRKTKIALAVVALPLVWFAWSFGSYVARDNGDTVTQRMTTWARNHHLSSLVDMAEKITYSSPPSKKAASKLDLVTTVPTTGAPATAAAAAAVTATTVGDTNPTAPPPATTTVGKPTTAPAPLVPGVAPALAGEGQWTPIARAGGQDAAWATSVRPLPEFPSVVASVALIDQTNLRAGMFNGSEEPGKGPWRRGNHVPTDLQASLVAAFNGGFRFEHIKGGYETEGRVAKPLKDGEATLAVSKDGRLFIGQLGRDLTDDGTWITLRQNLPLLVDNGQNQVTKTVGTWWGADFHNKTYVFRSAVCTMADGRFAYLSVGDVNASQLADAVINLGCTRAMQLDINGTWPAFFTFATSAKGTRTGVLLDRRMGGDRNRYLTGSSKEFFALFDTATVPAGSVLDPP